MVAFYFMFSAHLSSKPIGTIIVIHSVFSEFDLPNQDDGGQSTSSIVVVVAVEKFRPNAKDVGRLGPTE